MIKHLMVARLLSGQPHIHDITVGMYRISGSGSGWPDIRPFLAIRFRFRQKYWPSPDIAAG